MGVYTKSDKIEWPGFECIKTTKYTSQEDYDIAKWVQNAGLYIGDAGILLTIMMCILGYGKNEVLVPFVVGLIGVLGEECGYILESQAVQGNPSTACSALPSKQNSFEDSDTL